MHKKTFIILFIAIHIGFIFLQIHKQSYLVELSYQKQKNEKIKQELVEKRNNLQQQWYVLQNRATIKNYAQEKLGMKKISLHQIKQLQS
jgi:cell division protein FtsL